MARMFINGVDVTREVINLGSGGGSTPLLLFDGTDNGIILPQACNADYIIEVDFLLFKFVSFMPIIGNTDGATYPCLTAYNDLYYVPTLLNTEGTFSGGFCGRYTFKMVPNDGNYFNNVKVTDYEPKASNSVYLAIGYRPDLMNYAKFNGGILSYKITSKSTGTVIANYIPYEDGNGHGVIDTVSNTKLQGGTAYIEI